MKMIPAKHYDEIVWVKVDDEDFDVLNQHKWTWNPNSYAVRRTWIDGVRATIKMHRLLTNCPKNMVVDHINCDPTDNQKSNLRISTQYRNTQNRKSHNRNSETGFRGVTKRTYKGKTYWMARVGDFWDRICLGTYASPEIAAEVAQWGREQLGYSSNETTKYIPTGRLDGIRLPDINSIKSQKAKGLQSDNTTGHKHISFVIKKQRYHVAFTRKGKHYFVGEYKDLDKAIAARDMYLKEIQMAKGGI